MLKKFLKKLGYSYRRIRKSLKKQPDLFDYEQKAKEIKALIELEKEKFLTIYYADESGFKQTPCVPYGWQPKKEPLSIPSQKGKRMNVFGLMSANNELFSYSTCKSINAPFVINAIDDFATNKCQKGRSVIVIDNARIHHTKAFKAKIMEPKKLNVFIFYLPTYRPHLNLIETFWRKCKYEWLLPKHFESWKHIVEQLNHIFDNFGEIYTIDFNRT